jgi:hypothetical protein
VVEAEEDVVALAEVGGQLHLHLLVEVGALVVVRDGRVDLGSILRISFGRYLRIKLNSRSSIIA